MMDSQTKGEKVSQRLKKIPFRSGMSLVEVMNAIAILLIAVLGASGYRYCATLDARKAEAYITSARIGHLLSESWRGLQGVDTYDPTAHLGTGLNIAASDGPYAPEGFTSIGTYKVALNDAAYYVTLSWKDVSTDLRALNVVLIWTQMAQGQSEIEEADKSFELTTYVLN
jgi:prepilin-type N-terminal cleavage/methylation domain-containing protein